MVALGFYNCLSERVAITVFALNLPKSKCVLKTDIIIFKIDKPIFRLTYDTYLHILCFRLIKCTFSTRYNSK